MATITYKIPNISCNHCLHTIKTELEELEGDINVEGDVSEKTITVSYQPPITLEMITKILGEINYSPQ